MLACSERQGNGYRTLTSRQIGRSPNHSPKLAAKKLRTADQGKGPRQEPIPGTELAGPQPVPARPVPGFVRQKVAVRGSAGGTQSVTRTGRWSWDAVAAARALRRLATEFRALSLTAAPSRLD
jgi:hypothetical protein